MLKIVKIKPAIKWSGSKRSQSEAIISRIKDRDYNTYYEHFVGGASVLFQLLHSEKKFKNYVCSDIKKDHSHILQNYVVRKKINN